MNGRVRQLNIAGSTMENCEEWACKKKAIGSWNGRNFCSRNCAGIDSQHRFGHTSLGRMEPSISVEHGDLCLQPRIEDAEKLNEIKDEGQLKQHLSENNIGQSQKNGETYPVNDSNKDLNITQDTTDGWTAKENELRTPSLVSDRQLLTANVEESVHLNLVNSSIVELHSLMSKVAENVKTKSRSGMDMGIDPQLVNAACNCAKQMGDMLKIKLEAIKIMRSIK